MLEKISDKYDANLIVLGNFNYPKIDLVHYRINSIINGSNYKFLENTRNCFFQPYVKNSTKGRTSDNPSLLDFMISNNDDLIDTVSLLAPQVKEITPLLKY